MEYGSIIVILVALVFSVMMHKRGVKRIDNGADNVVGGVCAGLGRYFDVPANAVRIGFVLLSCLGVGLVTYIILWIVLPRE